MILTDLVRRSGVLQIASILYQMGGPHVRMTVLPYGIAHLTTLSSGSTSWTY